MAPYHVKDLRDAVAGDDLLGEDGLGLEEDEKDVDELEERVRAATIALATHGGR